MVLGQQVNSLEIILKRKVQPELLETCSIDYKSPDVRIFTDEFTCLCPKTSQPDFASIEINYAPIEKIVESKSLKLYLLSFRDVGIFHEEVAAKIANDLKDILETPVQVKCFYKSRGGISINPIAYAGI